MGSVLKIKDKDGNWVDVPGIKGDMPPAVMINEDGYFYSLYAAVTAHDIAGCCYDSTHYRFYYEYMVDEYNGFVGVIPLACEAIDVSAYGLDYGEGVRLWCYDDEFNLIEFVYIDDGTFGDKFKVTITPPHMTETDPTVPAWAKQPKKPNYTSSEVGAYSKSEVDAKVSGVAENISSLTTTVDGLRQQLTEEAHFRGYLSTNAKIKALEATPNDFAYSAESGTKWVYDAVSGWQNTGSAVPDQLTPASDTVPLMNGVASVGSEESYARGDHRHPTDTTRVSVEEFNLLKSDIETALDGILDIQNALIGGEGA